MPERIPGSPFRDRERTEKIPLSREVDAVTRIFEFTRRLRAKVPEDSNDVDKPRENVTESVGDHVAMNAYLMHYFLPLLEEKGVKIDYAHTFDMVLAQSIGDIADVPSTPGIQKDLRQQEAEIISTTNVFKDLPRRNGFNRELFDAYAEYLGQETPEAQLVHALNGLETMLYVLSRPPELRKNLVGGKGYTVDDYEKRIGVFCKREGFEPLGEFYTLTERLFRQKGYFAAEKEGGYKNGIMTPKEKQDLFISNKPDFRDFPDVDVNDENIRLLRLQRLKRKLRFGQPPKPSNEYHDTVPEHVAELFLLYRYFLPSIKNDIAQNQKLSPYLRKLIMNAFDLREGVEIILAHDIPEIIKGDVIAPIKTEADAVEEWDIATEIASEYAPRAGGFDEEFWNRLDKYESDRNRPPFPGIAWLIKLLDILEAQLYIFDPETREKLSRMHILARYEVRKKADPILPLFPTPNEHFDALEKQFIEEGLP